MLKTKRFATKGLENTIANPTLYRIRRLAFDSALPERYLIDTTVAPGFIRSQSMLQLVEKLKLNRSVVTVCQRDGDGGTYEKTVDGGKKQNAYSAQ